MNNLDDIEQFYPFKSYVARQSLQYLSGLQDSVKGFYIPVFPSLILNFNFSDTEQEYKSFSGYNFYQIVGQKQSLFFTTVIHELIHCYHIAGSSIGALLNISYNFQKNLLSKELNSYKKYRDYKEHMLFCLNNKDPFITWQAWQNIRCLFGNGYDPKEFVPQLKEYIESIMRVTTQLFYLYKNITNNDVNLDEYMSPLAMQMAMRADTSIDYLRAPGELYQKFDNVEKFDYFVRDMERRLFVPTRSILEGYARMCEIENIALATRFDGTSNLTLSTSEKITYTSFIEFLKQKGKGIYGDTSNIMGWILNYCDAEQFHQTALSIYELSLMVRLHPYLFCEGKMPKLNEILVPMRFKTLISFFQKNKTTISDFCNPEDGLDLIKGLDRICDALDWMSYSESLKKLLEFYEHIDWKDTYESYLSKHIINKKLNGHVYINNVLSIGSLPVVLLFQDEVKYPDKSEYDDFPGDFETEAIRVSMRIIKDTFTQELVYSSDLNETKKCFRRLFLHKDSDKSEIGDLLEVLGLTDFIKPEEMLSES